MKDQNNSEELQRIEKSNRAFEILATLPLNQRTVLIEGIVATLHLSDPDRNGTKRAVAAWDWWMEV